MLAVMVADIVADMEVDKVADMVANMISHRPLFLSQFWIEAKTTLYQEFISNLLKQRRRGLPGGASATTAKHIMDGEHVKGQTIELLLILSNNLGIK